MAKKITTIEGLAGATQGEFLAVGKRFDAVDKRFDGVDKRFDSLEEKIDKLVDTVMNLAVVMKDGFAHVNARIDTLHSDISDLPALREELHGLRGRVDRLERKTGVR